MESMKEIWEMELRVNKSMADQLSNDNIFKAEYEEKVKELEEKLYSLSDIAITVEESVSEDIFKDGEEVDEELEMWQLGELSGNYQFGTQSWDL